MNKLKVFSHGNNSVLNINKKYIITFIPLILFGLYKNGYILYVNKLTTILGLLKPLIIPVAGFIVGYLISFIVNNLKYKKSGRVLENYLLPIQTTIISMMMPINVNVYIFVIVLLSFSFINFFFFQKRKYNINFIALTTIVIIVLSSLINNTSISSLFINSYESSRELNHSMYRMFLGYNSSGISVTNTILVIIGYGYLSLNISYKKEITFYLSIGFIIITLISMFLRINLSELIRNTLNSSFIFMLVYVATDSKSSPYNQLGIIFYSILIIIFTILLSLISFELSLISSILIISLITPLLVRIFKKTKFSTR